ncbi:GNAT family N-acetyltransferase [Halosquirtibacter laminarini]|uniref:GNAT family N-acetyltransferase n=1 Tax=Halosquirtibacter laminarini TaxID=3374600 RepID=A0AC61NFQ1_9BACT|nr:GNAT family N-acetyltransferase [Prolixibacteraceae bacterium]
MQSFFNSKNTNLRPVEPSDIDHLYLWENDTNLWEVGQTTIPFSRFTLEQYVNTIQDDIFVAQQLRLIIEDSHTMEIVGAVDLYDFDPRHSRVGVGILIYAAKDRNKGYALEALVAVEKYVFHFLGLHQLYATVAEDNTPSINLFTKLDYNHTSTKKDWTRKGDQWFDQLLFQKIN